MWDMVERYFQPSPLTSNLQDLKCRIANACYSLDVKALKKRVDSIPRESDQLSTCHKILKILDIFTSTDVTTDSSKKTWTTQANPRSSIASETRSLQFLTNSGFCQKESSDLHSQHEKQEFFARTLYAAKTKINILDTLQNSSIRMFVKTTRYVRNDDFWKAIKISSFKSHIQKIARNFFISLQSTNIVNMLNLPNYDPNDSTKRPRRILLDSYNPP
ncbi:uncharacterized protein TNCV_615241 [Trichonephila clavipes]|nr:uncharacterized protein TNCV_615241 [Trichonephila clavipes]